MNGHEDLRTMLIGLGGGKRKDSPRVYKPADFLPDFQKDGWSPRKTAPEPTPIPTQETLTKKWQTLVNMRIARSKAEKRKAEKQQSEPKKRKGR